MSGFDNFGIRYVNNILTETINDVITFTLNKDAVSISGESGAKYAFINCKNTLQSFTVPENSKLETIQKYSFFECNKLESLDIRNCQKLISIGEYAFKSCKSLKTVYFPSLLTTIGNNCFESCGLINVTIPASVETIGRDAFRADESLRSCTFEPNSKITEIPAGLFTYSHMISFTVPSNVTKFSSYAFESVGSLTELLVEKGNSEFTSVDGVLYKKNPKVLVKYPAAKVMDQFIMDQDTISMEPIACDSANMKNITFSPILQNIPHYSFQFSKLETAIIPDSVNSIGDQAFMKSNLQTVVLSENLPELSISCFSGTKIETIIIPNSVLEIKNNCFANCLNLTFIQLPASLKTLGGGVFNGCSDTLNITFDTTSDLMVNEHKLIINKAQTEVSQYLGKSPTIHIPEPVKKLKSSCFDSNTLLVEVIFDGNNLTEIEQNCFKGCTNLSTIKLPTSLETIGFRSFYGCFAIKTITFSPQLKEIKDEAFQNCINLSELTFENSTKPLKIGNRCFYNCTAINNIDLPESLISIGISAFQYCTSLNTISIPSTLSNISQETFSFTNIDSIYFPSDCEISSIPMKAFYNSSNLASVTLSDNILIIETEAFAYTAIKEIVIPDSVTSIGTKCFSHCSNLQNFTVNSTYSKLKDIATYIFEGCPKLKNIRCNNANYQTDGGVLYTSDKKTLLIYPPGSEDHFFAIPQEVNYITISSFYQCTNLIRVFIPDNSVRTIGISAFEGCSDLRLINFPLSVQEIQTDSFKGCHKLSCGLIVENLALQSQFANAKLSIHILQSCINTVNCKCSFNYPLCLISLLITKH